MSEKVSMVRRVLLVEDDVERTNALAAALERAGYLVESTLHGEDALDAIDWFRPDICLVNVNVAGLWELDQLRSENQSLILANVTPFNERADWNADADFDLEFTKPSDPVEVADQLSAFLRKDLPTLSNRIRNRLPIGKPRSPQFRFECPTKLL